MGVRTNLKAARWRSRRRKEQCRSTSTGLGKNEGNSKDKRWWRRQGRGRADTSSLRAAAYPRQCLRECQSADAQQSQTIWRALCSPLAMSRKERAGREERAQISAHRVLCSRAPYCPRPFLFSSIAREFEPGPGRIPHLQIALTTPPTPRRAAACSPAGTSTVRARRRLFSSIPVPITPRPTTAFVSMSTTRHSVHFCSSPACGRHPDSGHHKFSGKKPP